MRKMPLLLSASAVQNSWLASVSAPRSRMYSGKNGIQKFIEKAAIPAPMAMNPTERCHRGNSSPVAASGMDT